ncbi:hypothetical protein L21SP3_00895 [Sedimentisphaera cyanobacteriorum]|uniref:Uncharacterized protein n=1 Tax=Sedimentisphaera cyanobacteriorum TaxID=1940790 RepID=A0A1Q2HNS3_9BACT|nr:hypothetical protein [Sedimentisphaera cyanobacteriorum]AQQ09097.1 hypothetical protein L21SP3_00895 [Sedimentisphaera cyanobacteriorum]
MKLPSIHTVSLLKARHSTVLFSAAIVCFMNLAAVFDKTGSNLEAGTRGAETSIESNKPAENSTGPILIMSYNNNKPIENPIASFMYFVPLISPTPVDNISSADNEQQVDIISHKIKKNSKFFEVTSKFEISGSGFHMNTFAPSEMIEENSDRLKKGKKLEKILDYIKLEGNGFGTIEARGRIEDSKPTVREVNLKFNKNGRRSPVTIGLYDVAPKDGEYKYENRTNEIVARVNTLSFEKNDQIPKMGITIASVAKKNKTAGFFGWIKGAIANLFIKPLKITKLGNTTMLDFGETLLHKKPAFTFPKADNIKERKQMDSSKQ